MLVGHQTFKQFAAGRRRVTKAYREFKTTVDLAELDLNPNMLWQLPVSPPVELSM